MRVIVQRVNHASVTVDQKISGAIAKGLLVLAAWEEDDTDEDISWTCGKLIRLRIFADDAGLMNLSVQEIRGGILLVSQFTLYASTRKGNRPSFIRSARTEKAKLMYDKMIRELETLLEKPVQTGLFGGDMKVALENDGPVTIFIDSRNKE